MKLEPIDTSTTEGKARVMQLAAEGRDVAEKQSTCGFFSATSFPIWDWRNWEYAIIAQPVGPDEVWVLIRQDDRPIGVTSKGPHYWEVGSNETVARYRRVEE